MFPIIDHLRYSKMASYSSSELYLRTYNDYNMQYFHTRSKGSGVIFPFAPGQYHDVTQESDIPFL